MTLSGLCLIAAPALPAMAAAAIAVARPAGERPSRWAVRAAAVGFAAAVVVTVVVAVGDPVTAVIEAGDGHALFGLDGTCLTAMLGLLTTGVGLVVQSFASRNLQGDLFGRRFFVLASLLTAATTSVAFAATLSLLCAAWIVAGLALAALVTHRATWQPARRSSRRTLRSLWVGDGALLVATLLVFAAVGEIDLRSPADAARELANASIPVLGGHVLAVVAVL